MLELRRINVDYEGEPALVDVDLSVEPGEVVALIGPSGAGKSTLLQIAAGLLAPASGSVWIDGRDTTDRPGAAALMPQRDLLLDWRDAAANVALPLEIRGWHRSEARAAAVALLERVGLGEVAASPPATLSGGMRQRVAVARTLIQERLVTLLDEPFGALDGVTRAELQRWLLERWAQMPTAALVVTHDVAEAVMLADRVLVMSPAPGRIVAELAISLGRPRAAGVLLTEEFLAHERTVRAALHAVVGAL